MNSRKFQHYGISSPDFSNQCISYKIITHIERKGKKLEIPIVIIINLICPFYFIFIRKMGLFMIHIEKIL
jgi:hypothetical protein